MSSSSEDNKKVILLVSAEHRDKVKRASEILNKTMGTTAEEAVDLYYDRVVYSPEEFLKFVKRHPRLSLYIEKLKRLIEDPCCPNMLKDIMVLDENCEGRIYFTTFLFDGERNKFQEFLNEKTESAVVVVAENPEGNYNELREKVTKAFDEIEGDGEIDFHNVPDTNLPLDKAEIFVFVKQKKDGGDNAKK